VLEAPPGAGKTTRIPQALLAHGVLDKGEIIVLQPRRLPARLAAQRVADELGEPLGLQVGYTVRFEDVTSPKTRIRFMTEGLLLRRLLSDPHLHGVSVVALDEFHERHLASDLALALLYRLQERERPDLRLLVMSATLDAEPICAFLGDCPALRSEGREFPVTVEYLGPMSERVLCERAAQAVRTFVKGPLDGDLLVFVPGAGEIRQVLELLRGWADSRQILLLPLHGELSPTEQRRAVTPAARPKIVVSTNVAESSVTIDGVIGVIDTGYARVASYSPWNGLPRLSLTKISQASAIQRAGRAGRTCPGRAIRLYSQADFATFHAHEVPEIGRVDLSEALLTLAGLGISDSNRFHWFDSPTAASLEAARSLLLRLSAIDKAGQLTETGRQMLAFPTHPRLARLMVEGQRMGVFEDAASLAALLSERDIAQEARVDFTARNKASLLGGDLLERLDRFKNARQARFQPTELRGLGVDVRVAEAVDRARKQYLGSGKRPVEKAPTDLHEIDRRLAKATLTAFPDRLMRRRTDQQSEAVLASGGAVMVGPLPPESLLVAVDAEERGGVGKQAKGMMVRMAVGVEPEWILDLIPHEISESEELVWNRSTNRVDKVSRLGCGAVVLDESRKPAEPSPEVSHILAEEALSTGYANAEESKASIAIIKAKLEVLQTAFQTLPIPEINDQTIRELVLRACEGCVSLAELRATDFSHRLLAGFSFEVCEKLRTQTPDQLTLPGGRHVPINYEPGKPPWVASRLQDFFGMLATPTICNGRVALTVHLLAPNQRAVQVTSDLQGFWLRHYPEIRRELCRRYPRHPWPDDGATAQPPLPRSRRQPT
jgi:ATP-dependent helicase HrpB